MGIKHFAKILDIYHFMHKSSPFLTGTGVVMSVIDVLKKYPEIEFFSRERSYELYQLMTEKERNKSPLAYLLALGVPVSCAMTFVSKLLSDLCKAIEILIQASIQGEWVSGNVQTMGVDFVEYGRSLLGMLIGGLVALGSPSYAAKTFLTIAADPSRTFLKPDEGARLYAMGDRLNAFFIRHKIDYRMCSGTALGAVRERGIIRNDDDIDLMLHPGSVDKFKRLVENGTLNKETGISIEPQAITGGWQCFYSDSPKGQPNTPTERIGKPFVDIFPGTIRDLAGEAVITYGEDKMYLQSKGDYFTTKEWGEPVLYTFGPTQLLGVEQNAMIHYLRRCYGLSALNYKTLLYPHEVYSTIYGNPLKTFSLLAQHPVPRYMRHVKRDPLPFDQTVYDAKIALAQMPTENIETEPEPIRIWVDGIYDLFHQGHQNINKNAIAFTQKNYPGAKIVLLIGVCGDGEDVQTYKRKPIMNLEERCNAIDVFMKELIKTYPDLSYQIIRNSPVTHTLEFIQQHRLNILFHGSDFTPEKIKKYYGVILEQCAGTCSFEILPYTKGVSTTELIGRLLHEGDFGDVPNTTGIATEMLAERVRQRAEEFYVPTSLSMC